MAEAIVDGTSSTTRFFCHQCTTEIEQLTSEYTCPICSTGFIEELERGNAENGSGMDMDNEELSDIEVDVTGFGDFLDSYNTPVSRAITQLAESSRNPRHRNSARRLSHLRYLSLLRNSLQNSSSRTSQQQQQQQQQQLQQQQQQQEQRLTRQIDSFIQDLFFNFSSIGFGFPEGQGGQAPVFFLGNPGDYVWGQNGVDSIVTQLLNQMDGTGPPPLPKKQIDKIPTTVVSQMQVDCKLQCSVCWEDFILEEPVRQLPCQHYYHAPCIVPWLELHGTCPICRQSLGDQSTAEANQDTVGTSLAALFRAANESNSSRSSSSRTSSASLGSSSRNDSPNEI